MTSAIIRQGMNFIREKQQEGADVRVAPKFQDKDFPTPGQICDEKTALPVEGGGFGIRKVKISSEQSGFSYFLDGIERKQVLAYLRSIPVIYGYVAGAILKRTDKKMGPAGFERAEEMFYLPLKSNDSPEHYFSPDEVAGLRKNIKNSGIKDKDGNHPILPEQFIQAAHSEIQTQRNNIEAELIQLWVSGNHNDGWLYVDGRLEKQRKPLIAGANVVGVIKSHQASYFNPDEQYRIYAMQNGERTHIFQPADRNGDAENVYSWYLRLHYDKRQGTNNFGIVRVEVPAEKRFIALADTISEWILLETKPIAFPASRWDRMIYPVKYCEDYLKSKAPTIM
ncbi:MAG: hypothetical protein GX568_00705 [Candidatus Gastranaerophilales bacterium]|nr:hypothetical protein [Candidatus Gastranaerophilales bacterium]